MELLAPERYAELEEFVARHPRGEFMQSPRWRLVKENWDYAAVVSRDAEGAIKGSMGVLIRKIPALHTALLYAPRGPICDVHDWETIADLKAGVDQLAKQVHAHEFKMDPDIPMADGEFIAEMKKLGFVHSYGPDGFEGIQARFNYRLYLEGRDEAALLANCSQGVRRNIRKAEKAGVEVKIVGEEALDDFVRIMQVTGERDGFSTRPKSYFVKFLRGWGENVRLYAGYDQGKMISGAICTNYAGKTCYVYGASDNSDREVMPNYLMQWEMIRWAVETGCTVYDFQGVSGNLDPDSHMYGLYRFKSGFRGSLDELAGEFDCIYSPSRKKLTDTALALRGWLRRHLHR